MSPLLAVLLASSAIVAAGYLNRRRLRVRWERLAAARVPHGSDGIASGGGPIAMGTGGRGVLLLHGFGDTAQSMRGLATFLNARGWTVRAPLLRGHGRSLQEHAGSRAEDWLLDARRALSELRAESDSVSIVGQSMGGALATILATETSLDALVLLAPIMRLTPRGRRIARFNALISLFVPYLASRSESSILDAEARRHALGPGVTTPRLVRELATIVQQAWEAAPRVSAPSLVIHSTQDPRIAVADAETSFARLGASTRKLEWARRSGHVLTVDFDRDWISHEVAEWLDAHARLAASRSRA